MVAVWGIYTPPSLLLREAVISDSARGDRGEGTIAVTTNGMATTHSGGEDPIEIATIIAAVTHRSPPTRRTSRRLSRRRSTSLSPPPRPPALAGTIPIEDIPFNEGGAGEAIDRDRMVRRAGGGEDQRGCWCRAKDLAANSTCRSNSVSARRRPFVITVITTTTIATTYPRRGRFARPILGWCGGKARGESHSPESHEVWGPPPRPAIRNLSTGIHLPMHRWHRHKLRLHRHTLLLPIHTRRA